MSVCDRCVYAPQHTHTGSVPCCILEVVYCEESHRRIQPVGFSPHETLEDTGMWLPKINPTLINCLKSAEKCTCSQSARMTVPWFPPDSPEAFFLPRVSLSQCLQHWVWSAVIVLSHPCFYSELVFVPWKNFLNVHTQMSTHLPHIKEPLTL